MNVSAFNELYSWNIDYSDGLALRHRPKGPLGQRLLFLLGLLSGLF